MAILARCMGVEMVCMTFFRAPKNLPTWDQVTQDLNSPSVPELMRLLDLSERTVRLYSAQHVAPRPVLLSLFWESSYGKSTIDAELFNAAQVHRSHSQALEKENLLLRVRVARLEQLGDFGCANAPDLRPVQVLPGVAA